MTTTDPPFDPDALRQRYRVERDKRIREDGNEQYLEMAGDFAHYLDDPYVQPLGRGPLADEVAVAVIGGGFGGLLAGARLREAGVEDLRIIEKGGDFGGTWYWNRYPGAACDIESYIYLPLLEEIGFMPKEKYTRAPEILDHSRKVAEHYDLYRGACFQTEVTAVEWHDADGRWIIRTNRGDAMRAAPPKGTSRVWPASASASSAPVPPRCSACPTWGRRPSSCSCSSARRRRSMCAPIARPIPSGPPRSSRGGSGAGWRTSTTSSRGRSRSRTSSTTAGPTSSASC